MKTAFIKMKNELKRVSWTTKKEVVKGTFVTLFVAAVFGLLIYGMDTLFSLVYKLIFV